MTRYEEAVSRVLLGEKDVRIISSPVFAASDRASLLATILRMTTRPIEISGLRFDEPNDSHYFLLRYCPPTQMINDKGELV